MDRWTRLGCNGLVYRMCRIPIMRYKIKTLVVCSVFLMAVFYSYRIIRTADGDLVSKIETKTDLPKPWIITPNDTPASKLHSNKLLSGNYGLPRYPRRMCESNRTYIDFGSVLTSEQTTRVNRCVDSYTEQFNKSILEERIGRMIRYTGHSYLNNNSFVIEAGGYIGNDVQVFNDRYKPGTYMVLEPVPKFFDMLVERFKDSPNVIVYNYGIDDSDGEFYVSDTSNDAATMFKNKNIAGGKVSKIMNVTKFMILNHVAVRTRDVDLLTMNCEGCEFSVLDLLLSTDYIRHFKNIQFQSHKLDGICYPVKRFCWYQELLTKTHKLTFQFKYIWENWTQIR